MIRDILLNITKEEFDKKWQKSGKWPNTKIISLGYLCYNASKNYIGDCKGITVKEFNDLSEYSVKLKMDFFALIMFRLENPDTKIDIEKIINETPPEDVNILIEHPTLIKLTIAIVDVLK